MQWSGLTLNVVIEIDEPHHKRQREKDEKRQNLITNYLRCTFIRLDIN